MNGNIQSNIEKFLINNLSLIMLIGAIFIILIDIGPHIANLFCLRNNYNLLSSSFTISSVGAIFAFWYGYKKFKQDKDIEIIEKFQAESFTDANFSNSIHKWTLAYRLFKRGYIPDFIWDFIEYKNINSLNEYLNKNLVFSGKNISQVDKKIKKISYDIAQFGGFGDTREYLVKILKNRLFTKKNYF